MDKHSVLSQTFVNYIRYTLQQYTLESKTKPLDDEAIGLPMSYIAGPIIKIHF